MGSKRPSIDQQPCALDANCAQLWKLSCSDRFLRCRHYEGCSKKADHSQPVRYGVGCRSYEPFQYISDVITPPLVFRVEGTIRP